MVRISCPMRAPSLCRGCRNCPTSHTRRSRFKILNHRSRTLSRPKKLVPNKGLINWPQELTGRCRKLLSAIPRFGGRYEIAKSSCAHHRWRHRRPRSRAVTQEGRDQFGRLRSPSVPRGCRWWIHDRSERHERTRRNCPGQVGQPELQFAFSQLLELFEGQSSKPEVLSELFWASLHGIAERTRTKRFPRSRQKDRMRTLVELFTFPR